MKWLLMCSVVLLAGCPRPQEDPDPEVGLVQLTGPPPTLTAELVDEEEPIVREIHISAGVAMGVGCWDYCVDQERSCEGFSVLSGDEAIIAVHDAFRSNGQDTFVLAAANGGSTTITVQTRCGSKTYQAFVE